MHLIILCHGMWGNIHHFDYIIEQLKSKGVVSHDGGPLPDLQGASVVAYRTSSNQGYFTYDGVDVCGLRVADEINAEIEHLENSGHKVTEISLYGYSMGGIMIRYAAGILEKQGLFDKVKPRVFTTMFSPHMGVRVLQSGIGPQVFNFFGSWSMARTSRQVFLQDKHHKWGVPLFLHLTSPGTPYMNALNKFESRWLYANIANDRRCEFYTASAEGTDPFVGRADQVAGPFIPGYEPTLIDGQAKEIQFDDEPVARRPVSVVRKILNPFLLLFKVTFAVPIWFCAFLINAAYQAAVSSFRTTGILTSGRLLPIEEEHTTHIDSLLEDEANRIVEDMYSVVDPGYKSLPPEIGVIRKQFNSIKWNKVYVHITADKNAHSAAIHRMDKPSFYEGKAVIKHWVEDVMKPSVQP